MFSTNTLQKSKNKFLIEHIFDILKDKSNSIYIYDKSILREVRDIGDYVKHFNSNFVILKEITIEKKCVYVQVLKYFKKDLIFADDKHYMALFNVDMFDKTKLETNKKFYGYKKITNSTYYEPVLLSSELKGGYKFDDFEKYIQKNEFLVY